MLQMLQGKMSYSNSGYKKLNQNSFMYTSICVTFPYGLQPVISGLTNQELLPSSSTLIWIQSCTVSNQQIWPHQTITPILQTYPNNKGLASLLSLVMNLFDPQQNRSYN